jgi:hypothetical protein
LSASVGGFAAKLEPVGITAKALSGWYALEKRTGVWKKTKPNPPEGVETVLKQL